MQRDMNKNGFDVEDKASGNVTRRKFLLRLVWWHII